MPECHRHWEMSSSPLSDSGRNIHCPYSPFIVTLQNGYERMISVVKNELFVFVVNGESMESNVADAVLVSTRVHETLRSTSGNFQFIVNGESITPTVFERFLEFAHSRVFDDFSQDEQHFFVMISGLLGNEPLMYLLLETLSEKVKENSTNDSMSQRTGAKGTVTEWNAIRSPNFHFHEIGEDHCASQVSLLFS
jgi:hypothetical protein